MLLQGLTLLKEADIPIRLPQALGLGERTLLAQPWRLTAVFMPIISMRMNQQESLNAENLLNSYSYEELKLIFQKYGEERYSNSIAKKIVDNRPVYKTKDLDRMVESNTPLTTISRH